MSRVEVIGDATLHLGDCRDILPTLGKVDAVVTDPPYGIGMDGGRVGKSSYEKLDWDSEAPDLSDILSLNCQCVIWGGNYFPLPPSAAWLVWDKETAGVTTFADCEVAWTNLKGAMRLKRHLWSGPYQKVREQRYHPTQKPVDVMIWAVDKTSGLVLDPFMGSGTTGVACALTDRAFIGIEREPSYFDIACRRIEAAYKQPRLFAEPIAKPVQEAML